MKTITIALFAYCILSIFAPAAYANSHSQINCAGAEYTNSIVTDIKTDRKMNFLRVLRTDTGWLVCIYFTPSKSEKISLEQAAVSLYHVNDKTGHSTLLANRVQQNMLAYGGVTAVGAWMATTKSPNCFTDNAILCPSSEYEFYRIDADGRTSSGSPLPSGAEFFEYTARVQDTGMLYSYSHDGVCRILEPFGNIYALQFVEESHNDLRGATYRAKWLGVSPTGHATLSVVCSGNNKQCCEGIRARDLHGYRPVMMTGHTQKMAASIRATRVIARTCAPFKPFGDEVVSELIEFAEESNTIFIVGDVKGNIAIAATRISHTDLQER